MDDQIKRAPMTRLEESRANAVLGEVLEERRRQHLKWGEQNHPDGTGMDPMMEKFARLAKLACNEAAKTGTLTWRYILDEEVAEANAESSEIALRAELIQVAAVATAWIEAIDRRMGRRDVIEQNR